jgi:hypothetical protein
MDRPAGSFAQLACLKSNSNEAEQKLARSAVTLRHAGDTVDAINGMGYRPSDTNLQGPRR